jgi:hypothetical protein
MGATPPAGRNPFGPVDSAAVMTALTAVGSYDPDVLYATKQRLLAPYRDLRRVAIAGIFVAGALVVVLSMPIFGLFAFVASAALWRFQAKQRANVESGYAQYLASAKS